MMWRRLCVDVNESGAVIGGSVELYDDSNSGASATIVLSGSETRGHSAATLLAFLYDDVGWDQLSLF